MTISSWRDLPFREIWVVDIEYYPGRGPSNGGREGDQITPLCLVALEMRTGGSRTSGRINSARSRLTASTPMRCSSATCSPPSSEAAISRSAGGSRHAQSMPYVEFRHFTNDGTIKTGDREKGFYALDGALRYFCEDGIDTAHKDDMRDRIIQGPPFDADERENYSALLRARHSRSGAPRRAYRADDQVAAACSNARKI